jgi:hypothetical protein
LEIAEQHFLCTGPVVITQMADEKKHKKRKPRRIITTRHDDNTYSHEHQHDDGKHSMFAGTSANVDDVKQHMDDNFGGPDDAAEEAAEAAAPGGDPAEV